MHDATWELNPTLTGDTSSMTQAHSSHPMSSRFVALAIAVMAILYGVALYAQLPQDGTKKIRHAAEHVHPEIEIIPPSALLVTPFLALLGCIAILPLLRKTEHWWESNLHRFYVAGGLGILTLLYFLFLHGHDVAGHWPAHYIAHHTGDLFQWEIAGTVFANAILYEYIPFIVLLFALYTISGGICIEGNLAAHPLTNTAFIGIGGLLASFVGTTGAAMLLIRPLLETNKERRLKVHTIVFFIFVVCNCGGLLLPIGDPPLFLGYLRGVDFFWTLNLWPAWLAVNIALLLIYWAWDHFFSYPKEQKRALAVDESRTRRITITGWGVNVPLLAGVVACVALLDPSKPVPGTTWHAPLYLREMVQLGLVALSLWLGSEAVRSKNRFNYGAILEVAALFLGIFICMQPALQILNVYGAAMGVNTPHQFFWATGVLSSVLDNAPTYVVFFETAVASGGNGDTLAVTGGEISVVSLIAISLGAVFMGAMTYIGNGPNFMVKAIAETSGVRMPSFFGYMKYSCAILLPLLLVTTCILFWLM